MNPNLKRNNIDKTEHYQNQKVKDWKETLVKMAFDNFWKCFLLIIVILASLVVSIRLAVVYIAKHEKIEQKAKIKDILLERVMHKDDIETLTNRYEFMLNNKIEFEKEVKK